MAKKKKADTTPATISLEQFQDETALMPHVIARTVLEQELQVWYQLPETDREWFLLHCSARLRSMYSHAVTFRERLLASNNRGRDMAYMWIRNWAKAFLPDIPRYKREHADIEEGLPIIHEGPPKKKKRK